ncbi:MAG: HPr(Ser) kinase/phosphatase, partial [Thermoanaerobaculia bacterium]
MTRSLSVRSFLERSGQSLNLRDLNDGVGLDCPIPNAEVSSPGLALAGYVDRFVAERLQILGET